jgi:hypothetical protein
MEKPPPHLHLVASRPDPAPVFPPRAQRWLGSRIKFRPSEMREHDAKYDGAIRWAARVKDYPLLENVLDGKMDDQGEFVRWWREIVPSVLAQGAAASFTGIKQQQVERWAEALRDRKAYGDWILIEQKRKP